MDKLYIKGPTKLSGSVEISKAKNTYLPILAGILLFDKPVTLKNVPNLRDINTMIKLLEKLGVTIERKGKDLILDAGTVNSQEATYDLVKTMRASIFTLGPMVGRFNKAKVSLPGGCAIGTRPIDLHIDNLEKLGANIVVESGYVEATSSNGLVGAQMTLAFPSVGATENLMMAAVYASGTTVIDNAAKEPEIDDLANFLNKAGAKISGIGTSSIKVEGVKELNSITYEGIGDRIEGATYLMAALMTNSEVLIQGVNPKHLDFVLGVVKDMGAKLELGENSIKVFPSELTGAKIDTAPFPGFPTDVQAQMMALMTQVGGSSIVTEHIFENRFMHVPELARLGAKIELKGNTAFIEGSAKLKSAPVMCTDLRASAALVLAALVSEGETEIQRVYHLDRGYENLDEKFRGLGVDIRRVNENA